MFINKIHIKEKINIVRKDPTAEAEVIQEKYKYYTHIYKKIYTS